MKTDELSALITAEIETKYVKMFHIKKCSLPEAKLFLHDGEKAHFLQTLRATKDPDIWMASEVIIIPKGWKLMTDAKDIHFSYS